MYIYTSSVNIKISMKSHVMLYSKAVNYKLTFSPL